MPRFGCYNDLMSLFMNEFTARIVAETGKPTDRFHLGKMILQGFKDAPDFVTQINGVTGESETNKSALNRTVKCALGLTAIGLKKGDVLVLIAPTHLDLTIPFYAGLYLGIIVTALDQTLTTSTKELARALSLIKPKIIFCQNKSVQSISMALGEMLQEVHIVTFDKTDNLMSFTDLCDINKNDKDIEEFKATDFDAEETIAFLIQTSGTTGKPKAAALTHKNFSISASYIWRRHTKFPTPTRLVMVAASLHWLTAYMLISMSPILRYTRLHSTLPVRQEHAYYLINTYKPTFMIFSATIMYGLMKPGERHKCDFSCVEMIQLGGSPIPKELVTEIQKVTPNTEVACVYGLTEAGGMGLCGDFTPLGSCGKPLGTLQYRLIDIDSQEDIDEPFVQGELWLKGASIFKEYYNDLEETAISFTKDGWFKTGDVFYRDENFFFYFVERVKLLLKYNIVKIYPLELENIIRQHPGVLDVVVIGLPDPERGDLPTACVITHQGYNVTAQEVKNLILENLSERKELAGGVLEQNFPVNASMKIDRKKLMEMVLRAERL